jgi:hypothetical protein
VDLRHFSTKARASMTSVPNEKRGWLMSAYGG